MEPDDQSTKRVDLESRVTFEDKNYGPGEGVEVPSHFPEPDPGEPTSQPLPERVFRKPSSSPPNTGGVDTGEGRAREAVPGGIEPVPVSTTEVLTATTPLTPRPFPT